MSAAPDKVRSEIPAISDDDASDSQDDLQVL